jgi:hypothetical protein
VNDERVCTGPCGRTLPAAEFARDARLKSGRRARCKKCDRDATAVRRRDERIGRKPGALALVLAPKFPTPPADSPPPAGAEEAPPKATTLGGVGTYVDAAEEFIAALDPPAGPADALLVHSLRHTAELADRFRYGLDVVKDTGALHADLVRIQRELAATRAARAKAVMVETSPKSKLGRFGAASA